MNGAKRNGKVGHFFGALALAAVGCTPGTVPDGSTDGSGARLVDKSDGYRIITVVQCTPEWIGDGEACHCECDEHFDGTPFVDPDCDSGFVGVADVDGDGFRTCGEVDPACEGLSCGDSCSNCPPGRVCPSVAHVCNYDGRCGLPPLPGRPMCFEDDDQEYDCTVPEQYVGAGDGCDCPDGDYGAGLACDPDCTSTDACDFTCDDAGNCAPPS